MSETPLTPNTRLEDNDFMMDFDVLAPPKRIAKLGGEEIDVSIVSTKVALKFMEFSKKHKMKKLEQVTEIIEIVALVCENSSKKITKDWLLANVDISILLKFVKFVFEPLTQRVKEMSTEAGQVTGSDQAADQNAEAKN
jgi:hypothetical protein